MIENKDDLQHLKQEPWAEDRAEEGSDEGEDDDDEDFNAGDEGGDDVSIVDSQAHASEVTAPDQLVFLSIVEQSG